MCLCVDSSDLIVFVKAFIFAWDSFLDFAAKANSSPRITHLCASQRDIGDTSGLLFSAKYRRIRSCMRPTIAGSFKREGLKSQIFVLVEVSGKERVQESRRGWDRWLISCSYRHVLIHS